MEDNKKGRFQSQVSKKGFIHFYRDTFFNLSLKRFFCWSPAVGRKGLSLYVSWVNELRSGEHGSTAEGEYGSGSRGQCWFRSFVS